MSINDIQRYPGQILGIQKNDLERATAISCELDDQNRGVVRIVDAAPFAYNNSTDKLKVEFDESDFSTSILRGVSTDGLPGMLIDDTKNFEDDMFLDKLIKINVGGITYYRKVASNTKHAIFFSSPLEAPERASVVHGNVNGGQITIHYHEFGEGGNNYSVEFIKHEINGIPVSAELNGYLLTVKLEVNDQNEPISAGMDTAAKISLLSEFEAQMTGSGGIPELTLEPIQFSGGKDGVYASEGTIYEILEDLKIDDVVDTRLTGSNAVKGVVQNVATAGTREQLPDYPCREVTLIAKRTNTGRIFVGGDDVSITMYGVELEAKDSITLTVNNTNLIYIDASVNGEGISYVAI